MPKASKPKTATARKDPISKPEKTEAPARAPKRASRSSNGKPVTAAPKEEKPAEPITTKDPKPKRAKAAKDPKASHLYTDDNPATTIHGTGFKDVATADKTLELIRNRSLTYQFQTVNTLFHRAKNHPALKKGATDGNANIRAAMDVFKTWIDDTYPAAKAAQRVDGGFKPLLSKGCVERYLPSLAGVDEEAKTFARVYTGLGRNKRLGNTLVDDSRPTEADWEVKRYEALCGLVPEGRESAGDWEEGELWVEGEEAEGKPSELHAKLIAWAWSPLGERRLP